MHIYAIEPLTAAVAAAAMLRTAAGVDTYRHTRTRHGDEAAG
jgi:hypothetical protein